MAGELIFQLGTAIGAARAFPYLLKQVVGLNMILPTERRKLIADNEKRDAERRNKLHDAELDIRIERLRNASETEAGLAMAADVGAENEVLTQIVSVLTDEDHRTLRGASYLARIFARAVDGLPPEVDREITERGGLNDEWVEAFRGWGKVASSDRTQQILAQILRAEITGSHAYPASFIAKLRALDEATAQGFTKIVNLVFGEVGVIRVFGNLNEDPLLQRLGLGYQDFVNAEDERLLDRDKEFQWKFDQEWREYKVGGETFRFRATVEPGKHPAMRLTPFGHKLWTLMPKQIDRDYLKAAQASCAANGILCELLE